MMPLSAAALCDEAVAAARSGDGPRAVLLFDRALAAAPRDASVLSSAGTFFSQRGDHAHAITLFERAVAADPQAAEPLVNLAILLTGAGRAGEALDFLRPRQRQLDGSARYWSVRANAERSSGDKRAALASYRRAAELDSTNPRAIEGRARLALETGLDAREYYQLAIAAAPNSPTAIMGYGQALEAEGEAAGARAIAERLVDQSPGWIDGLEWLAQLRWGAGERDEFTSHYQQAARRAPTAAVYASWCHMLQGVDRFAEAAEVAATARTALGDSPPLALLEANHASEAGDDERAAAIFARLPMESSEKWLSEARHCLRTAEAEQAEQLTARVLAESPDSVSAWALRDIAWRLLGDPRHQWLHGQEGLVRPLTLEIDDHQLAAAVAFLDALHDKSTMPVGQSVRDGSQTRGGLLDRHEPEVRVIEERFQEAVEHYRQGLPPADESHPLLRYRNIQWRFAGSWSIRVFGGGRHREHIHSKGLVSSAAYFVVPPATDADPQAGWLELGRPPSDLRIELPPLFSFAPIPGTCALFPSTLFHGTRPFPEGKRMTVAVDVHAASA
ncbi:MAG: tetratricopeptide repeat protein [Sphingomonas sp.]|nr:tetratricopeptide repeat protein [Sphingomonas sp.]